MKKSPALTGGIFYWGRKNKKFFIFQKPADIRLSLTGNNFGL